MWVYREIRTLGDYVDYHAARRGSGTALVFGEHVTTYAELAGETWRVARGLEAVGVPRGLGVPQMMAVEGVDGEEVGEATGRGHAHEGR